MSKHLMHTVLPRLARPLYRHLEKFQTGQMTEIQFNQLFEGVLEEEQVWLAQKGISAAKAAILIHAGVLILSRPGLKAEAEDDHLPFEVVEQKALRESAQDVSRKYNIPERRVMHHLAGLVAKFEE